MKNIGAKFESSSQGELGGDVKELSENVRILDGNLSAFSDEVSIFGFKRTDEVLVSNFDAALDRRIKPMEEMIQGSPSRDDRTPTSGKKRKIVRLPDLSVSK